MDDRARHQRIFTVPNIVAAATGIGVFFLLAEYWTSYAGGVAASLVAGSVSAGTWLAWIRIRRGRGIDRALPEPAVGALPPGPSTPTPLLTAPHSRVAEAYRTIATRLERATSGQVLLVAGASADDGASTVALNLAITATQLGRRVVLIDGDLSGRGLSRFGSTGPSPGLSDLARGTAGLGEASRMWDLAPGVTLPFIPPGAAGAGDDELLRSGGVAQAIDRITEHADLLLIDVPPPTSNGGARGLAAHADGSVLVVAEDTDPAVVTAARARLREVGAPVLAHVVNRAGVDRIHPSPPWRRMFKRGLATAVASLLAFAVWNGYQVWDSWRSLPRDTLDVAGAEELLRLPVGGIVPDVAEEIPEETLTAVTSPPTDETLFSSFLVVGSDAGGYRADVIILVLLGSREGPVMVSIPRDLYLPNRCTQGYSRINATYNGCGSDVNGPTLLALTVEDLTGIPVDHFALFDFDGFEAIIDEVGGIEVCVDHPVRDRKSRLDLPAGCNIADGEQALAWVRSRSTQEWRDGEWRVMPGVSDLSRNARQQDVILAMLSKLKDFESPADLSRIVRSVSAAFTLDSGLGMADAISLVWDLRDLDASSVRRVEIPVQHHTTSSGAQVLLPTTPFDEIIAELVPELAEPV
jgi:LCP family protein required for cell wall assembly